MTVGELIERLRTYDPALPVYLTYESVITRPSDEQISYWNGIGNWDGCPFFRPGVMLDAENGASLQISDMAKASA